MHPLLDSDKQIKAQQYEKEKRIIGISGSFLSITVILLYYYSGFSRWIAFQFGSWHVIFIVAIYVIVYLTISTIVGFPLSYYSGFRHEKKWNFSNHSFSSWLADEIKSFLIGIVLAPILLGLMFWLMDSFQESWWLVAGIVTAGIGVVFATLFPVIILPLFNKYTPVDDDELTNRLTGILDKAGLQSSGFFIEDMSKQTTKENAFLAGLGRTRRVVLGDNLLDKMTNSEVESVIAHEVGHYQYKHIWKNIALGTTQQIILFYLLHQVMLYFFPHFLESVRWNLTLLPMFGLFFSVLSTILFSPLNLAMSRYFERQADATALRLTKDSAAFQSAMAGLANRNLSNAYPSTWVKLFFYSHPPIGERLEFADNWPSK